MRSPGHDGREPALRIEVGEQSAEIALVGAVPVREEEHPLGIGACDQVADERHARSSCGGLVGATVGSSYRLIRRTRYEWDSATANASAIFLLVAGSTGEPGPTPGAAESAVVRSTRVA